MRKAKKALAVGLTVAMSMTMLAGCGDKESSGGSSSKGGSKVDELYLYNSKGENAEAFEAMGKAYRMAFSWIIKLAGYEPTPAEEMRRSEHELKIANAKSKLKREE